MLNEIINSNNDKLVPYVTGSFIAPFNIPGGAAADSLLVGIYSPDDVASKNIRIKRIRLNYINDAASPSGDQQHFKVLRFYGKTFDQVNVITSFGKNTNGNVSATAAVVFNETGFACTDIAEQVLLAEHIFSQKTNLPGQFELSWEKALDPTDHIILPPTYGIVIVNKSATANTESLYGFIEWDEIA